jgi:hypothetical protein
MRSKIFFLSRCGHPLLILVPPILKTLGTNKNMLLFIGTICDLSIDQSILFLVQKLKILSEEELVVVVVGFQKFLDVADDDELFVESHCLFLLVPKIINR